jgi:hypothetical protein
MRLALSSAAAPDATFRELLDACVRRGLGALELESGHGHDLEPRRATPGRAAAARAEAAAAGVHLAGLRMTGADLELESGRLAEFALALGAPLLVPVGGLGGAPGGLATGLVRVVLPSGPAGLRALDTLDQGLRPAARQPLAWDAAPGDGDVSDTAAELLARVGPRLRHIRLYGGGPEAAAQEGRGVGALLARLALTGFDGSLALAPSSLRYRVAWSAWLGRRGGWGCGSRTEDRQLVSLEVS